MGGWVDGWVGRWMVGWIDRQRQTGGGLDHDDPRLGLLQFCSVGPSCRTNLSASESAKNAARLVFEERKVGACDSAAEGTPLVAGEISLPI